MARFTARYADDGEAVPNLAYAHMRTMRGFAIEAAVASGRAVEVLAGDRVAIVFQPDGSAARPAGARAGRAEDDCKRGQGLTCFCPACRAERREKRAQPHT